MMRNLIIVVIIAVLIIFGLVIFAPDNNQSSNPSTTKLLSEYSDTDAKTSLLIDGEINGEQQHRSIQIIVGRSSRVMNIFKGYNGQVINSKNYGNSETAYNVFLSALNLLGFTKQRDSNQTTPIGVCPFESRYTYELNGAGKADFSTWSSDCGPGTMGGQTGDIQELFQAQIPNYEEITNDVEL